MGNLIDGRVIRKHATQSGPQPHNIAPVWAHEGEKHDTVESKGAEVVTMTGEGQVLLNDPKVRAAYLGE